MRLGTRVLWFVIGISVCLPGFTAPAQESKLSSGGSKPAAAYGHWMGPDGQPLPFNSDEEMVEFLRKASIGKATGTGRGVTQPRKVQLERDGVVAHGIFHDVNQERRTIQLKKETIMNFRDSYLFQIGAYELARMIGLHNIPPSVKRSLSGTSGSLTFWLEGMITEEKRQKENREPEGKNAVRWNRQMAMMKVWDALIYNFDRNQGNILIDKDWNVWLIDHTRSFRTDENVPGIERLTTCERGMFERMRALDKKEVEKHLRGYVMSNQVDYIMRRRDKLVAHFEALARQRGENEVFFTYP